MDSGGNDQQFSSPSSIPAAPTYGQQLQEYIANLPQLLAAEQQYNPQFAQLYFDLASQYFPKYTQLNYDTQKGLYPQTTALQENLATQANEGMNAGLPGWARDMYLDQFRAELGTNAGSPIGADYASRGLMQQTKNWQDYYRNLGLAVTNRLPLTQTAQPQFASSTGAVGGFGNMLNYNQGTYGNYVQGLIGGLPYAGGGGSTNPFGSDVLKGFLSAFGQYGGFGG